MHSLKKSLLLFILLGAAYSAYGVTITSAVVSGLFCRPDWSREGSLTYRLLVYDCSVNWEYSFESETAVWVDWNNNLDTSILRTYPPPSQGAGNITVNNADSGKWTNMVVTNQVQYMADHPATRWGFVWVPVYSSTGAINLYGYETTNGPDSNMK
jgi:hypothetical protein